MADINPLRYRGYYYDAETGFYYLQSRYYDPQVGRFISADEFASTGQGILGTNMFAYCENNPISRADISGFFWDTIFDFVSLGFSVADVIENPTDFWAWGGLAGDIIDLVPFVTGVGEAVNSFKAADRIHDTITIKYTKTIKYTNKVIDQMDNVKDLNHTFPAIIDKMVDMSTAKTITGGDGIVRKLVQIPGAINGRSGFYEYIFEPDGWCNHRFFREVQALVE